MPQEFNMSNPDKEQLLTIIRESWKQFATNAAKRREHLLPRINTWCLTDLREALFWLLREDHIVIAEQYRSRLDIMDMNTFERDTIEAALHAEIVV